MNPLKKAKRNMKRSVAKATGVPTTKSGRKRKADSMMGQVIVVFLIIGVIVYFFSGGSAA